MKALLLFRKIVNSTAATLGGLRFVLLLSVLPVILDGAEPTAAGRLGAGAKFEILQVGGAKTFRGVLVRSVNVRSVMISHEGGLAAVRLRDLTPELQAAFGYDPTAEAAADAKLRNEQLSQQTRPAKETSARSSRSKSAENSPIDQLLQNFGTPPEIKGMVDLRPKFFSLALNAKNQGPRPSCAIFAIVSALEFQNALLTGETERFSEEYLLWATCKTLNRAPRVRLDETESVGTAAEGSENLDNIDEGFALSDAVTALRAYGIPLQKSLPYSFAKAGSFTDPPREVIAEAKNRRRVSVISLPGHDQSTVLANLVHALHAGVPVAVGMRWPPSRALRGNNLLNAQKPSETGGHAVTIVGYENKTGAVADTIFVFKNSWGVKWGAGGFGFVSYRYLFSNLMETALLEVSIGNETKS